MPPALQVKHVRGKVQDSQQVSVSGLQNLIVIFPPGISFTSAAISP